MPKPLKIITLGDLHFEALKSLFPKHWKKHVFTMLDQVTSFANLRGIKTIFITGDIFNVSKPAQADLLAFYKYIKQHSELHFIFMLGNHDIQDANTNSLQLFAGLEIENCKFITEPTVLRIQKHKIVVLPWPHTKLPKGWEGAQLGFAHVIAENTIADNGRKFTSGERLSKKIFWIIGDLHKNQRSKYWYYPGACLQFNFQDDVTRYFAEVTLDHSLHIKEHKLQPTYKLLTKTLTKPSDFAFLDKPNTFWRIYADAEIDVPSRSNIIMRLPRTKIAKNFSKDVTEGLDKVVVLGQAPKADDYLKQQGYKKHERRRLIRKLMELR